MTMKNRSYYHHKPSLRQLVGGVRAIELTGLKSVLSMPKRTRTTTTPPGHRFVVWNARRYGRRHRHINQELNSISISE
ncbi:hypothetical protein KIN20_014299 [Parelaphostrongylus tenuis]|uniref:Uncharacterized protein n=1 Tax=Parelaphostrongylus tenuis TaxID=148309 RepID=A0AAD5MZA3_PARTN|nr:hypothetical protein KIN20_014299 [Parelaphostrongylus tenuis]